MIRRRLLMCADTVSYRIYSNSRRHSIVFISRGKLINYNWKYKVEFDLTTIQIRPLLKTDLYSNKFCTCFCKVYAAFHSGWGYWLGAVDNLHTVFENHYVVLYKIVLTNFQKESLNKWFNQLLYISSSCQNQRFYKYISKSNT